MGKTTAIAWTSHTFNPWWGCTKVSPACDHCYAETFARRTGQDIWSGSHRFFGDKHWAEPLRWPAGRVFCASMADVFESVRGDEGERLDVERARLWALIEATPHLTWQLLTKRPEQVAGMVPGSWLVEWPANVWLGTSAEDQIRADLRIPRLLAVPGSMVRFVSCEPLLGPVDLERWADRLDWVIAGGESGPGHRPINLDHARSLRDQCAAHGVAYFFKQVGGARPTSGGDLLDGQELKEFPHAA